MTNAVAIRNEQGIQNSQVTEVQRLGGLLAASGYFADAREMAQAAVKVLAGQELGIPPVAAMMGINIIKGKVALSGNLIASRVRAHGYEYRHKQFDNKGCVLEFLSKPGSDGKRTVLGESSFTEEDAKTAGVFSDMYRKFPRNMFFNRSMSNGAKWFTPEVTAGMPVYVPEELGATVDEQGDMVQEAVRPAVTQQQVADHKIAEMKAGKSYAEVSSPIQQQEPGPRYEGTDADIPQVMGGQSPEPSLDLTQILRGFTKFKNIIEAFEQMKEAMAPVLGVETYYRILGEHNMKHANEFGTAVNAKACFSVLWGEMQAALYSGEVEA